MLDSYVKVRVYYLIIVQVAGEVEKYLSQASRQIILEYGSCRFILRSNGSVYKLSIAITSMVKKNIINHPLILSSNRNAD